MHLTRLQTTLITLPEHLHIHCQCADRGWSRGGCGAELIDAPQRLSARSAPFTASQSMSAPDRAALRPLSGDAGYKRLVRLLGRAFYAGECPPKEADEEVPAGQRVIRRDKVRGRPTACRRRLPPPAAHQLASTATQQNEYIGLGVLLLDFLAAAHGYVKDQAIVQQLGVSGKVANRALRYLQGEGLLQSGAGGRAGRVSSRDGWSGLWASWQRDAASQLWRRLASRRAAAQRAPAANRRPCRCTPRSRLPRPQR